MKITLGGPLVELQGRNGLPEMRANLDPVAWGKGDWNAYYQIEFVDSMYESSGFDVATLSSTPSGSLELTHDTKYPNLLYCCNRYYGNFWYKESGR